MSSIYTCSFSSQEKIYFLLGKEKTAFWQLVTSRKLPATDITLFLDNKSLTGHTEVLPTVTRLVIEGSVSLSMQMFPNCREISSFSEYDYYCAANNVEVWPTNDDGIVTTAVNEGSLPLIRYAAAKHNFDSTDTSDWGHGDIIARAIRAGDQDSLRACLQIFECPDKEVQTKDVVTYLQQYPADLRLFCYYRALRKVLVRTLLEHRQLLPAFWKLQKGKKYVWDLNCCNTEKEHTSLFKQVLACPDQRFRHFCLSQFTCYRSGDCAVPYLAKQTK